MRAEREDRVKVSFSGLSTLGECRKKFELRYVEAISPVKIYDDQDALVIGGLIDKAISFLHDGSSIQQVLAWLDKSTAGKEFDDDMMNRFVRCRSMIRAYAAKYLEHPLQFIGLQVGVEANILNPATERSTGSRTVEYAGILDGIIIIDGQLWIYELKTTSRLDMRYLESLWNSSQTGLYAFALSQQLGIQVAGVLYDIIEKAPAQMSIKLGETNEEYLKRKTELAAASKRGVSTAKQQVGETWAEFEARLDEWHRTKGEFRREQIVIDEPRMARVKQNLWAQAQDITLALRYDLFWENSQACRPFIGRECEYLALCQSGHNQVVRDNMYQPKEDSDRMRLLEYTEVKEYSSNEAETQTAFADSDANRRKDGTDYGF